MGFELSFIAGSRGDYLKIRKDIQEFNQKVRSECPDTIAKKTTT